MTIHPSSIFLSIAMKAVNFTLVGLLAGFMHVVKDLDWARKHQKFISDFYAPLHASIQICQYPLAGSWHG